MAHGAYQSMESRLYVNRRQFLAATSVIGAGVAVLGTPSLWAQDDAELRRPQRPETNIDSVKDVPRTRWSIPGAFPGKVVRLHNPKALVDDTFNPDVIKSMFTGGMEALTGKSLADSFELFIEPEDIVGIKVNPVGAGLISTRLELVDAVIDWLEAGGLPRENIVIWDRFSSMLTEAGFTEERFPGIRIVGLQEMFMPEEGQDAQKVFLNEAGEHKSLVNFDRDVYYWADVDAPTDAQYHNQHVVNGKYSYFGRLVTRELTKIINLPVFKNTGNGISVATKNLGYAAICNTGRLHRPLFFDVCTEVVAFPAIRDKVVLNITDGLRAQYDGGPGPNSQFVYDYNTMYFATDPFASDMICHNALVEKRKEMKVDVNEHPRYTDYLRYGERLGLGIADVEKISVVEA